MEIISKFYLWLYSNDFNMEFVKRLETCMVEHGGTIKSIMVIGDDNQAIYGFRNANPDNMIHFEEKMGVPVKKLYMTKNYRSYEEIINPANALVALNVNRVDKPLIAAKGTGGECVIKGFGTEDDEIKYTINIIKELLESGTYEARDIAIIAHNKKTLGKYSKALADEKISWVMMAPVKLMDNSRVRAAIKLCDAFFEPDATQSYFEYLVAKYDGKLLNEKTDDEINAEIEEMRRDFNNMEFLEIGFQQTKFHNYLEAINLGDDELYQKWLDMLYDAGNKVDMEDPNASALSREIKFIQDFKRFGKNTEAKMDQRYEGIVLTTAHSSKGLEWPIVINTISDYDSRPLHKAQNVLEVEEKRRLLFVSMTRAMEKLYVTSKYVAYSDEFSGDTYNQFLKDLYQVTNKAKEWDAELLSYRADITRKAQERKDKQNERARERRAERKADERAMAKALLDTKDAKKSNKKSTTSKSSKTKRRELTESEKATYNKLVSGAKQMSVTDILK